MAEKPYLSDEVKKLKLGKSFESNSNVGFHTFRYDFVPSSVDVTKKASVEILGGSQITVTSLHVEESKTPSTVFKGSIKPYQKDCVLIIDHNTGEATLEKLCYNVQLKKTREEGSSKVRPITPVENLGVKRSSPNEKLSPKKASLNEIPSPKASLPLAEKNSPVSSPPSLMNGLLEKDTQSPGSDDDASSDSSTSDLSESENSDQEMLEVPEITPEAVSKDPVEKKIVSPATNSLPSMPKFNQLNEDLKLSESDSESDN